jgi:hypothetical protein
MSRLRAIALVSALSVLDSHGVVLRSTPEPTEYWPSNRPRKRPEPVDIAKRKEVAEHNAEIERRKAEKKARKLKWE